ASAMSAIISDTAHRVADHTADDVNRRIRTEMHEGVGGLAKEPAAVWQRLDELDAEWDVERWVETISATLTLSGLALGAFADRRWLLLSGVVQAFFVQHAIQGWCPPVPILRRMGVRTQREIEAERHALKAFLGDYDGLSMNDVDENDIEADVSTLESAM